MFFRFKRSYYNDSQKNSSQLRVRNFPAILTKDHFLPHAKSRRKRQSFYCEAVLRWMIRVSNVFPLRDAVVTPKAFALGTMRATKNPVQSCESRLKIICVICGKKERLSIRLAKILLRIYIRESPKTSAPTFLFSFHKALAALRCELSQTRSGWEFICSA